MHQFVNFYVLIGVSYIYYGKLIAFYSFLGFNLNQWSGVTPCVEPRVEQKSHLGPTTPRVESKRGSSRRGEQWHLLIFIPTREAGRSVNKLRCISVTAGCRSVMWVSLGTSAFLHHLSAEVLRSRQILPWEEKVGNTVNMTRQDQSGDLATTRFVSCDCISFCTKVCELVLIF